LTVCHGSPTSSDKYGDNDSFAGVDWNGILISPEIIPHPIYLALPDFNMAALYTGK
jgi:hypothetical protein